MLGTKLGTRRRVAAAAGALTMVATAGATAPAATAAVTGGSSACPSGTIALKIDRAPVEGEVITDGTLRVLITDVRLKADGSGEAYGFDYTATGGTVVVTIVKGGTRISRFTTNTGLNTQLAPGGRHFEISFVTWCYTTP